jgi:hypothetical protein
MREQFMINRSQGAGGMDESASDPVTGAETARPGKLPVPQMLQEGPTDGPALPVVTTYPSAGWSKARHRAKGAGAGRKRARPRSPAGRQASRRKARTGASRRRQTA